MRSPHEALGHFALESAMDELAYATRIDPVKLRLLNDTEIDPLSRRPFSTRLLRKCLTEGAARFGWEKRTPEPRSMRDGRFLIGQGMAAAIYTHWRWPAKAGDHQWRWFGDHRNRDARPGNGHLHRHAAGRSRRARRGARNGDGAAGRYAAARVHASIGSATMANAGASVLLAANAAREKAIDWR